MGVLSPYRTSESAALRGAELLLLLARCHGARVEQAGSCSGRAGRGGVAVCRIDSSADPLAVLVAQQGRRAGRTALAGGRWSRRETQKRAAGPNQGYFSKQGPICKISDRDYQPRSKTGGVCKIQGVICKYKSNKGCYINNTGSRLLIMIKFRGLFAKIRTNFRGVRHGRRRSPIAPPPYLHARASVEFTRTKASSGPAHASASTHGASLTPHRSSRSQRRCIEAAAAPGAACEILSSRLVLLQPHIRKLLTRSRVRRRRRATCSARAAVLGSAPGHSGRRAFATQNQRPHPSPEAHPWMPPSRVVLARSRVGGWRRRPLARVRRGGSTPMRGARAMEHRSGWGGGRRASLQLFTSPCLGRKPVTVTRRAFA
jgi:hypothetical protein